MTRKGHKRGKFVHTAATPPPPNPATHSTTALTDFAHASCKVKAGDREQAETAACLERVKTGSGGGKEKEERRKSLPAIFYLREERGWLLVGAGLGFTARTHAQEAERTPHFSPRAQIVGGTLLLHGARALLLLLLGPDRMISVVRCVLFTGFSLLLFVSGGCRCRVSNLRVFFLN